MHSEDVAFAAEHLRALSLHEALDAMTQIRTTAVELTGKALVAAEACQRELNAFSVLAEGEKVAAAATESDRRYAEGRPRALEGLPIAVKDLIDTCDLETRYGSTLYRGHRPSQDAEVVRRLRLAGAIVIGKTTTHEFAWGVTTSSPIFGDTLNPHSLARTPGGSSGGAGAAVSYGAVAASLGTDTGGSVRIPAALCGVVGFKPTFGAVPVDGIFPLAPTLDHPGIIASSVDDVDMIAEALGIQRCPESRKPKNRAVLVRQIGSLSPTPEVADAFDAAIRRLGQITSISDEIDGGIFEPAYKAFATTVSLEAVGAHFRLHSQQAILAQYNPETLERIERSRMVTVGDYADAQQVRRELFEKLTQALEAADFILLPTCPCTAPKLGETNMSIGRWNGTVREALMTYTAPFNLTGLPAVTIPMKSKKLALPVGLQIVAAKGRDRDLLAFAKEACRQLS